MKNAFSFFFIVAFQFCTTIFAEEIVSATEDTVVQKPLIQVIGIQCRTSNDSTAGPQDIPKLWTRFYSEAIAQQIPNKVSTDVIALYCDYEKDHTTPYTFVIGCPVSSANEIPDGMVLKTIPAGSYAHFHVVGKYPKTLIETWVSIWQNKELKRTYTGDYELYKENFYEQSPQEVDVFIAIDQE